MKTAKRTTRGEEPGDLSDQKRELFEKIRVYVPVIRELEAEGGFFEILRERQRRLDA